MATRFILSFLMMCSLIACRKQAQYPERAQWSAFETLSVPREVRRAEFAKGNLVPNFSFEKGRERPASGAATGFELDGWDVIGGHVEWSTTGGGADGSRGASHDQRAVKITRTPADVREVDNEPSGVRSDFIEVIPGNYDFSLDVRLEKVAPSVPRLNARLGRDIDFRLEFYDRDKRRLGNGVYYEYIGQDVDNSFKGFAFSNFYDIEEFPWGRVNARTLNYPFSEGDLPDGCFFIRISLGLKGSGTMWVDNVNFSYSRWNFTPLERVELFFDKACHRAELVIPTPRTIGARSDIDLAGKTVFLTMPPSPAAAELTARDLVAGRLKERFGLDAAEVRMTPDRLPADAVVISIGQTGLLDKYRGRLDLSGLAGHEQGYVIRRADDVIFLAGGSPAGTFYAAATFVQLFDPETAVIRFAEITDSPSLEGRSAVLSAFQNELAINSDAALAREEKDTRIAGLFSRINDEAAVLDEYAFYKLNKFYNNYGALPTTWWEPGRYFEEFHAALGRAARKYGGAVQTAVMLNPYYHFEYEAQEETLPDAARGLFSHADPKSLEKIKKVFRLGLDNGARTLMLCADDFVPHAGTTLGEYTLFTDLDKERFTNLAQAQTYLLSELLGWLDTDYPGTRLEFCPAPYLNQFIDRSRGSAEAFFRDLSRHLSPRVAIVWTGNTVRSLAYDHADIRRYTSHIGRRPMIWDNTPYARHSASRYGGYPALYPGKAVMCNLFEPHDVTYPEDFADHLDGHYYSNLGSGGQLSRIQYLTFADFTWNLEAYQPDFALFKALTASFGKDGARNLLAFNDRYYALVAIWAAIRNGREHRSGVGPFVLDKSLTDRAERAISQLNESYARLASIENEVLKAELKSKLESLLGDYRGLIKDLEGATKARSR